jgi:hypothetical protein
MDSYICTHCESKIVSSPYDGTLIRFSFEQKLFCSNDCIYKYANKKIESLNKDVALWKSAWFGLREIIGRLGLEYIIEPRYEKK